MSAEVTAIAVAPRGVSGAFAALVDRLAQAGITVHVVDDLGSAADIASRLTIGPPALLLDLQFLETGADVEDIQLAADHLRRAARAIPHTEPIAVTGPADAQVVVACIRAGAGDVIDIQLEGTAAIRAGFQRQIERAYEATTSRTLRTMIEDLLKDLIRTERRSIDLEEKLAQFESVTGESVVLGEQRQPTILLVETDAAIAAELGSELQREGIATLAYTSGEDATRALDTLPAGGAGFDLAVDLAVIAAQLPGIDGLETVRRLRESVPGLPAFLVTSVHDGHLAARAADLGVVGFVQKPLPHVGEVVGRLAQLARESLERTREQLYLQRIKARHERVLARYRSLPREP